MEVKNKLRDIFSYYASYGDRLNTTYLKSSKFHKMMMDCGLTKKGGEHNVMEDGILN
jgi:hypothetical protein